MVYLHSGLSRAEQGFCHVNGWCCSDLRRDVERMRGVFVSPDYRGDSWLNAAAEADLASLIVDLKMRFEMPKTVLAGGSMGGTAALVFASHHPDLVDGVISVCPASDMVELYDDLITREELMLKQVAKTIREAYKGTPIEQPQEYAYRSVINYVNYLKMPIALRHGDQDEILPATHSRRIVDALRLQGTKLRYDEVPDGTHYSVTADAPWAEYMDWVLGK